MKRPLVIVVPYRDRATHLSFFIPHLQRYFERDKQDHDIPYRLLLIEQEAGLPFNRGALKNIGFLLGRSYGDYTCFHDVDYLPVWADYSWPEAPTSVLWYGAELRPVAPSRSSLKVQLEMDDIFGGVVLFPNDRFVQIDGYSNGYWGWGYEDNDVRRRVLGAGLPILRRKGTFQPLDHDHEGWGLNREPTLIAKANGRRFVQAWAPGAVREPDGLSTVSFEILSRAPIPLEDMVRPALWEVVKVRLNMAPTAEQEAALKGSAAHEPHQ